MEWYELEEGERVKQVYSRFKIRDFFNWWQDGQQRIMEIRIKDYNMIKEVATRYNIPYSPSGVYIWQGYQLQNVISFVRDKATMWFGVQPRKKNYNKWGNKSFGGKETNVSEIAFLIVDIDRVAIKGPASKKDLEMANKLCNMILDKLKPHGWNKSYIKICSGHGVQLLIKLDFPIKMPELEFDNSTKIFIPNKEYEKMRKLISLGIGKDIARFSKKFKDELGVEVDKSIFNIGRVGALPVTKNFKYDMERWRGIIELVNGANDGLSDYVLSKEEDIEAYKSRRVFINSRALINENRLRPGKLREHKLTKLILNIPSSLTMINNYLWFQFKCLLRDSKIDLNSKEFRILHAELKNKLKRTLTLNLPDKKFSFDENIVNKFCINNLLPLTYELWPNRRKRLDMKLDNLCWDELLMYSDVIKLSEETDIIDDMKHLSKQLVEGDYHNIDKVMAFTNGCLKKYGEKKAKYYFDTLFYDFFSYEI